MSYSKNNKILYLFILLSIFIIFITILYIKEEKKDLLNSRYKNSSKTITKFITSLIEEKQNATLTMAISLAKDDRLYSYLKNKEFNKFEYKKISSQIQKYTKFKNVWIQIVNKDGYSIYRSWDNLKNDDLHFRKDVIRILNKKDISTSINIGKYDLSIKAKTPIFDLKDNFLGFIEVITHFNSITKQLKKHNIDTLVIVDKKYNKRIKYPFTKKFVNGYYIANKTASNDYINFLKNRNIEDFLHLKEFKIINNKLINSYVLKDENGEYLGSIISFLPLEFIDIKVINENQKQMIMFASIIILVLSFLFIIYINFLNNKHAKRLNKRLKNHIKQLKLQKSKRQLILDSQSNIIIITDGEIIINSNMQLLNFFTDVKNLNEFKEKYICICNTFIQMYDPTYITNKDYDGKNWAEYISINQNENFKVAIYDSKNRLRHFSINCSKEKLDKYLIITLTDITKIIKQKQRLKYLNNNLEKLIQDKTSQLKKLNESLEERIKKEINKSKEKDRLLFQQLKITAIADTIKNIAHQWRQPLSTISTATSGMQLQKEMNILSDEDFEKTCDAIIENTIKLSKTIDNFSNYFVEEDQNINFSIIQAIKNSIKFLDSTIIDNFIKIEFEYDKDFVINGHKTEFQQCIINLLDNSIYAVINNKDINNRIILIKLKNKILNIKDSGEGINKNYISKIFEPYFTTKHQTFGMGMGLYMVHEFLIEHMHYQIDIQNCEFLYQNKTYNGAEIIIDFN
ncbi:hypothetical protein CPU12_11640 [Malaciobacter molluscorum LMG 25693]|uniref:histidine kinase n=1 Tax=Malaciobacter molluscorum LMG 25693 TaxID=870501 RepID=A0A2G1DFZ0_9BACT|nr:HAMP domain-containing sensor histidine kinase [Malaciobacter molluscorum]AXX91758.1 Cache sensor-containing signal transduction histidine kinase [Malaciobacter molluscorum LMG 25693]PHO17246.1 hypothetical protein CPU12_11640 [Malaciobacter molluscorum LMG 25693]